MRKIVIFGGSGFIGSRISGYLRQKNIYEVLSYSSADCDLLSKGAASKALSACNENSDVIICSAVARRVEESWGAMLKNITMVENIVSSLPVRGLGSVIFLSSVDVYGMPVEALPIDEDTKLNPSGYYGLSKLICEQLLQLKPAVKNRAAVLRLPAVYGAGDKAGSVIGGFVKNILGAETVKLYGGGLSQRDFVEAGDLCRIIAHFIENPFSGVVNVATGQSIAVKDLVSIAARAAGKAPDIRILPGAAREGDLVFDTRRLKSLCPGVSFIDIKKGVENYINNFMPECGRRQ